MVYNIRFKVWVYGLGITKEFRSLIFEHKIQAFRRVFRIYGLVLRVFWFGVSGFRSMVYGLWFIMQGLGFSVYGLEFTKKFRCLIFEHKIKAVRGIFWENCGSFRGVFWVYCLGFRVWGLVYGFLGYRVQGLEKKFGVSPFTTKLRHLQAFWDLGFGFQVLGYRDQGFWVKCLGFQGLQRIFGV